VWRNVFTSVEHNTTGGGLNVTELTPLTGDDFGTFPLYYRVTPSPYPAPPPPPKCDDTCKLLYNDTDAGASTLLGHANSSSPQECKKKKKKSVRVFLLLLSLFTFYFLLCC
jgi:hypothetical protein